MLSTPNNLNFKREFEKVSKKKKSMSARAPLVTLGVSCTRRPRGALLYFFFSDDIFDLHGGFAKKRGTSCSLE